MHPTVRKMTKKEKLLRSPSPVSLPQLLGNRRLTEPAVEAVEVQQSSRLAASVNVIMRSEALGLNAAQIPNFVYIERLPCHPVYWRCFSDTCTHFAFSVLAVSFFQ